MVNSSIPFESAHQYAAEFAISILGFSDVYFTGHCPVQGYGKTPYGLDFYFRSRGETASLEVYPVIDGEEGDSLAYSSIDAFEPYEAGWIGSKDLTQIAYVFHVLWQDIKEQIKD